ncbi:AraC family transcriptional regulator [Chryseobacterium fluminis]|uniref:helix-turn-helix domain-containing protein n=1 Tax=Chryseobacterium fluminis TaxID=2983606 RepID=UPI00224F0E64|nr:AraC family transcriptional regulator [Chryseobacterium sp. MMS21-Ot14]UZT99044.1 AraC family transcriptional regulator [Chryseobacterium sp. MMS21-Ot14]
MLCCKIIITLGIKIVPFAIKIVHKDMSIYKNQQKMLQLASKLGIPVSEFDKELHHLQLNEFYIVDMLPEMMVMVRSLMADRTFSYSRKPIDIIGKGLMFSFQNIVKRPTEISQEKKISLAQPHVRIAPLHLESEVIFPEGINITQVTILIGLGYLKNCIGYDQSKFEYLFNDEKTLLIEEFMSPEMADVVNDIADISSVTVLPEFYCKIKVLQLLFLLFKNLLERQYMTYQSLRSEEIQALYKVRDRISSSLDGQLMQNELVAIAGMNILKLRKLFAQVFGKGLLEYHQHLRMQEAARLIREEKLSVSEAGYRLGFSNLSYFGRLFEKHFGMKPKKWSALYSI